MDWPTKILNYKEGDLVVAEDIETMTIRSIEGETCTVEGTFVSGQKFICSGVPLSALEHKSP